MEREENLMMDAELDDESCDLLELDEGFDYDDLDEEKAIETCTNLGEAVADLLEEQTPADFPIELVISTLISAAMSLVETDNENRTDGENGVVLLGVVTRWLKNTGHDGGLRPNGVRLVS
jgi:hypothetical protein